MLWPKYQAELRVRWICLLLLNIPFKIIFLLAIVFFDTGDYFTLCKMLQLNDDKTPSTDYDTLLHTILFVRMAKRANLEDPLSMMFEKIKGTKEIP